MEKHLVFLIDCPSPGKFMMFPDYYENIVEELGDEYEEVSVDLTEIRWSAHLKNNKYKVLKVKKDNDGKDRTRKRA